jgi:hypothetical protein
MADYFDPAVTVNSPVSVFSCAADGGENANIVKSVSNQGGYGRLFDLEGETHTSLLNPAHAVRIAREVRYLTRTMVALRSPLASDTSIRAHTELGNHGFSIR